MKKILLLIVFLTLLTGCGGGGSSSGGFTLTAQVGSYIGRYKISSFYYYITQPGIMIEDVTVSCNGQTTKTNSNGIFSISGLSAGTHQISFSHPLIQDETQSFNITENTTGAFVVDPISSILARAYISANVTGASIYVNNMQLRDALGGDIDTPILIEDIPVYESTPVSIFAVKSGYNQSSTVQASFTAGQQTNITLTLTEI